MRIVVSGWFADQSTTGSGQYLAGLQSWLPLAGQRHEWILLKPGRQGAPPGEQVAGADAATDRTGSGVKPAHSGRAPAAGEAPDGATGGEVRRAGQAAWRTLQAGTPFDAINQDLAKVWFEQVTFPWACHSLHADAALVPYWGSPWWQPCPLLVTVHDIIPLLLPLYRGGAAQRAYTWLVTRTARRAAAVLTDSEASRRDIMTHLGIPADAVHAVHLAAGDRFRPVSNKAAFERVRLRYNLPGGPFLLYLGGFDARKHVPQLLAAYARLRGRAGPAGAVPRLVIAGQLPPGDSDFAPDPRPIAEHLGVAAWVDFTGRVDEADKPALYSLALAALFVSEYEGFGLPVLEAQACGCPVITSS